MKEFDEAHLGYHRVEALVERGQVSHALYCTKCGDPQDTVFWLAILGWTPQSFLEEAFPEVYRSDRG